MTPADLAELLKTTAAAVLAEHDLDTAALPADGHRRAAAQPRARRLRHQPGPAARQEGRRQPARAGRLAGRGAGRRPTASPRPRSPGPGFVNMRLEASAQGVIVDNVIDAGARLRPLRRAGGHEDQPGVRLGQPDRTHPHRRHPLGRRRRRAGPAAVDPGRRRDPRVLLQRPRRPDRPVRQLADRRRQGRARARGRLRGQLHRRHRRRRCSPRRPTR